MQENSVMYVYYYFDNQGNKIWTPNETLALVRARVYDSEVFRVEWSKENPS